MHIPTSLHLNDTAMSTLGFALGRPDAALRGARDVVERQRPTVSLPGLDGVRATDLVFSARDRTFTTAGHLVAVDTATLFTNYQLLEWTASTPDVRVRLADHATREIVANLKSIAFAWLGTRLGGTGREAVASCDLTWQAEDPAWRETSNTSVDLSTVAAACALGTLESFPVVTVNGADSAVDIEFLDSADALVAELQLGAIAGGATVVVDMATRTITHSSSGVTPALKVGGRFFALDPRRGGYPTPAPKARLSVGTGAMLYRKRYRV